MKVVFVLFVAMAAVEMSFALKCNYGQSKGKDDFFMVETCHPNVNKCVAIKLSHNGKTIYQAGCDENEAEDKLTCNEKKTNHFLEGVTWDSYDVCCCSGDNCNNLAYAKAC